MIIYQHEYSQEQIEEEQRPFAVVAVGYAEFRCSHCGGPTRWGGWSSTPHTVLLECKDDNCPKSKHMPYAIPQGGD